jgi:steroid 5-alpha reductase family enzyme
MELDLRLRFYRRLESGASADRRHHQVKRRVLRKRTFLDQIFASFFFQANLDQLLLGGVMLAEVLAQSALTTVKLYYLDHWRPPFDALSVSSRWRMYPRYH